MAERGKRHRRGAPKQPPQDAALEVPEEGMRINRYIARAGICSRRKADGLIDEGLVKINGEVVTEYWHRVEPNDAVEVNGRLISPRRHVYILVNKPKDVITTTSDERGRRTVLDIVTIPEEERAGIFPVGRLDRDTVGTLLLTNDGELAHRLMHPRYEIEKHYVIRTKDPVKPHELDQLLRGVELDDGPARADRVARGASHHEVGIQIHEGRNRQLRRMFEAIGHQVVQLERVNYAGLNTEGLRRGRWRRLEPHEIRRLRNQVNLR